MSPFRVLLVRPPGRFMSLEFPDGPMVGPPRSLLYLAAAVGHRQDVECRILDALGYPDLGAIEGAARPVLFGVSPDRVAEEASAWGADVVAISTMANYYQRETLEVVRAVREALPDAFVVLGGPDPTVDADVYLVAEPGINAIVIGEGEASFAELIDRLVAGEAWRDVRGIAYREQDGVVRTPNRPLIIDLDDWVPDYGLIDLEHYFHLAERGFRSRLTYSHPGVERSVDLVTSRGCPFHCTFCTIHSTMGRRFRTRSVASVLAQLRALVEDYDVRHVHFEDDILNLGRTRFMTLLQGIVDAEWVLTWDTPNGIRADLLDREVIELCRESGCAYLMFGVESGSQRVLDQVVDKQLQLRAVEEAAQLCLEVGLDTMALYVVGMPGETLEEVEQTYRFAFDLFHRFGTTPLLQLWRPYLDTTLHDRAADAGLLIDADALELHRRYGIPYTQFRDRMLASEAVSLDALSALFQRYERDLATGQLGRWRREVGPWQPAAVSPSETRESVVRFVMYEAPFPAAHLRRLGWPDQSGI
ncbi:MAG: radical SAM protein [Deltaproteobacteria bacterium]|nr:radical SAM protein [Deltaproteobacteria bacterium]